MSINTIIPTRVAELSATLKSIDNYHGTSTMTEEMYEEANDYCSYNASFYCNGHWIKPIFDGNYKCCLMERAGEYQVLRFFNIQVHMTGLSYDEIPENWEDDDAPDMPELEFVGCSELKQIWIDQQLNTYEKNIEDIQYYRDETFNVVYDSLQDWAFEPKAQNFIKEIVNETQKYYNEQDIDYIFSKENEYLCKNEPAFGMLLMCISRTDFAKKYYRTIRIAHRHHFRFPTDENLARFYCDYITMLDNDGKDILNPKFICPYDVLAEHQRILLQREESEYQKMLVECQQYNKDFELNHSYLTGIEFDNGHFLFSSLDSPEEYVHEGYIMHHCIGKCKFYNKHDVLSMHVSDFEGNRVATCSINVKEGRIIELQTICNEASWRLGNEYKEIWNTLMARMHTFPKRKQQTIQITKVA